MLVALSLLWFLGLRYPLQMLPVLLFELAWKLIWMIVVVLPLWTSRSAGSGHFVRVLHLPRGRDPGRRHSLALRGHPLRDEAGRSVALRHHRPAMITVESVTRTYGAFTAVDDVSFTAQPGRVTGFLGPNGAGKSTTMRIIVGLTRATSGTATISGRSYVDLPNPGLEVGVLLDASAQHAGRTGREILTIAQRFMGLPRERVEEMLDLVSLTSEEASRRVRDYSLGMRQRLGIATALIGEPEVLILDEPANGLDPAGIRWMRGLLRDYADRGGTVLLSSHLLHEIEVMADDLVVIGNGRIVAQGAKSHLLRSAGSILRTGQRQVIARALIDAGVSSSPVGEDGLLAASRHRAGRQDRLRRRRTRHRAAAGRRCRPGGDVPPAHRRDPTRHHQRQANDEGAVA